MSATNLGSRGILRHLSKDQTLVSHRMLLISRSRSLTSVTFPLSTFIRTMTSYSSLPEGSTDPRDANLVIRELLPGMITFSQPFVSVTLTHHCGVPSISNIAQSRFGVVPIGGRSTAIRVNDGIFVYVSHPYTTATAEALKQLGGEVKWLVTPDGEHGMNIGAWAEQFPEAKYVVTVTLSTFWMTMLTSRAIGVSRFEKAKPNVKWAGLFGAGGEDKTYGFEPEVSGHMLRYSVLMARFLSTRSRHTSTTSSPLSTTRAARFSRLTFSLTSPRRNSTRVPVD